MKSVIANAMVSTIKQNIARTTANKITANGNIKTASMTKTGSSQSYIIISSMNRSVLN